MRALTPFFLLVLGCSEPKSEPPPPKPLVTCYQDLDHDGYGVDDDRTSFRSLACGSDYATVAGDCQDHDRALSPGAQEVCNGIDDDCDGRADTDAVDASTWYADADGDGYGNPDDTVRACNAPNGYVAEPADCDDTRAKVYPGATGKGDGKPNDCDLRDQ